MAECRAAADAHTQEEWQSAADMLQKSDGIIKGRMPARAGRSSAQVAPGEAQSTLPRRLASTSSFLAHGAHMVKQSSMAGMNGAWSWVLESASPGCQG